MSRDRLGSLLRCSQRWGCKQYKRARSSPTVCLADVSEDSLRVLKQVEVIRDTLRLIESDLPAVRESLRRLLAAVNDDDKQSLQERLFKLSASAKRTQRVLFSMGSSYEKESSDSTLARIVNTHQMRLSCRLMKILEELRECHEMLATMTRKQRSRSSSLAIVTDCIVLPLPLRPRSKSNPIRQSASCPEIMKKLQEEDVTSRSPQTVQMEAMEKQLADLLKLTAIVADLVSDQTGFGNIEHHLRSRSTGAELAPAA